jgi:hypothetical protein
MDTAFRKIDIDQYDEDRLVPSDLYDPDPRGPDGVLAELLSMRQLVAFRRCEVTAHDGEARSLLTLHSQRNTHLDNRLLTSVLLFRASAKTHLRKATSCRMLKS